MNKHILVAQLAISILSFPLSSSADELRGAGSTFAAGAYTSWGSSYSKEKGVGLVYQATGSGDGIKQIVARSVDFGATDYALSAEELQKNGLIQIPTLVSGVVPAFNVPSIKAGQLRLTGPVLAAIFSGKIVNWNDREIQQLNPDLRLPNLPIKCVVRSDGSGTTAGFTEYLGKMDPDWNNRIGTGLTVNWSKNFQAVKGNDGMSNAILGVSGAIGYVSANQVAKAHLVYPLLQNRSKSFVAPTNEALLSAVKASSLTRDGDKLTYVDMPGTNAWPITDATYILIERAPKNPIRVSNVLRFFYWSFLRGDSMATETGYVPLPTTVQARAVGSLRQVRDVNDTPLDFMSRTMKVEPTQLSRNRAVELVPAAKGI
jgi:phosphate transport system substrate-binding protein